MSTKRRLVALLDHRLARRVIIAPIVLITTFVGVLLSPLIVAGAALSDVIRRRSRWERTRLVMLILGALIIETLGMIMSLVLWPVTGFGFLGNERWRWHLHRRLMGWYTRGLLALITKVIGTNIIWKDNADLSDGPVVVVARHTSFFDAVIPGAVLSQRNQLLAYHVVTHGLRYSPCIDIVGHRLPAQFIKRSPGEGSSELASIEAIGRQLDQRSGAIIFPEGTFRSSERFERVIQRIRRRKPELADRAEKLSHVLPPRANGTYALLQGAPDADVVVCTNTGLESFGSIKDIINKPYTDRPVVIETWRINRSEIPDDPDDFNEWLFDQFVVIDNWVTSHPVDS